MKIGTHNGNFHCDEVLACSMLKLLPEYKDAEILRTRDPKALGTCDIVVDVGGVFDPEKHRYDHHQKGFNETMSSLHPGKPWVTKLSSAGLVYAHFGKKIISHVLDTKDEQLVEKIYDKVYEKFIEEIDAGDNGIPTHDGEPRYEITTTLACRVSGLGPQWNDKEKDFDAGFYRAMDLVLSEFLERINYYAKVWWPARGLVIQALENRFKVHSSGRIILLNDGGCPFKGHLLELEIEQGIEGEVLFAVFPDQNGTWRVMGIPVKTQRFNQRMNLRSDWLALRDEELSKVSGIPDCIFVHAAGFIGGNKTKEGALQMAIKTIEANKTA